MTIRIRVNGSRRTITAFTDSSGNFNATFQPLPNEGGTYTVGADHPGVLEDPVQDTFSIVGMRADPTSVGLRLGPGRR